MVSNRESASAPGAPLGGAGVTVRAVSKEYKDRSRTPLQVLDEVSVSIKAGQFVCLVGPSGCGKSTLLNMIAGFELPTTGSLLMDQHPIAGPSPARGVVFQDPAALFPWLSVWDNIMFGLRNTSLSRDVRRQRVVETLDLIGLHNFSRSFPQQLSGGMRQLVALARVMVMNPSVLLMDEPFASLDALSRQRMQGEVLRIWLQHRTTVVFVTHSVEEAIYLADRVIVLSERPGKIIADVPVYLSRPRTVTSGDFNMLRGEVLHLLGFD